MIKPQCPIYKPGDPRIAETLRQGGGVGVDYSDTEASVARADFEKALPRARDWHRRVKASTTSH